MSQRARADYYARKAKAAGHPARSIYKLEEIDKRWRLLKPGQRVLELGAAPGSWTQYAAQKVGAGGAVHAVDLQPLKVALPPWVTSEVGDAFTLDVAGRGLAFDVLLSDMAPRTMGDRNTDALRSVGLAERALHMAERSLLPGGSCVLKVLEGRGIDALVAQLRKRFTKLERLRPKATRSDSTEIFMVGLGFVADPTSYQG